jgi:hypothetical protein
MFGGRTLGDLRSAELATAGFAAGVVHGHLLPIWSLLRRVGLIEYRRWHWTVTMLLLPVTGALAMLVTSNRITVAEICRSSTKPVNHDHLTSHP